jgi:hypothetical protein
LNASPIISITTLCSDEHISTICYICDVTIFILSIKDAPTIIKIGYKESSISLWAKILQNKIKFMNEDAL